MFAQQFVLQQQLVGAQQQLGEIDHALTLALLVIGTVVLDALAPELVVGFYVLGAQAGVLVAVDEVHHLFRRMFFVVNIERLEQALDRRELVRRVEDLEHRRQSGLLVMRPQETVAQTVEGADPHAAQVDRQHRREARRHFLGSLVGKGDSEDVGRRGLPGLDQPGDAGGEHSGFAGARAGKNQCGLVGKRDSGKLFLVQIREEFGHRVGKNWHRLKRRCG